MTEKIRLEIEDATDGGMKSVESGLKGIDKAADQTEQQLNQTAAAAEKIGDADVDAAADGLKTVQKSLDSVSVSATEAASSIGDSADAAVELGQAGKDADVTLQDVADSIETLTQKIEQETKVVHEHTSSWTHFGAEAIPAIAAIVGHVAKYSAEIAALTLKQQAIQTAIEKTAQSQAALNLAKDQGAKAALRAAGALTGYLQAVSGALAVVAGFKAGQIALNIALENTGKSADGLTNNLTRTREANSQLWDDIKATASAGAEAVGDWGVETVANAARTIDELVGVSDAWKEVDRALTESTNNYVNNTKVIGEAIRGVSREAVAASQAVAKAQADAADDFERVRTSNEEIEQAAKNRAEAERIASLDTVEAINSELQAMQKLRGEMAAANKFSEDDQKRYVAIVGQLEQQRTQITKRNAEEREKILKQEADRRAKSDQEYLDRYEAERNRSNNEILDEYREQARKEIDERKAREKAVDQFIEREMQKILDEERQKFNAMQQAAKDRLELLKQERQARIDMIQNAQGGDGKNMLESARQQISPEATRAELVRRARQQARANFTSQSDDASKIAGQRNAAEKQAGIEAFRAFNAGKTSEADIAGAQNALIQNATRAAQGRGQLDDQTANALMQAAQNQQNMIATQERQAQQLRQIQAALGQVGNAAQRNLSAQSRKLGL